MSLGLWYQPGLTDGIRSETSMAVWMCLGDLGHVSSPLSGLLFQSSAGSAVWRLSEGHTAPPELHAELLFVFICLCTFSTSCGFCVGGFAERGPVWTRSSALRKGLCLI